MQDVLMLASSGSGAMEASIRTFCKKPLCINSGKFGERFVKIARAYDMPYVEIVNDWDTPPSSDEICDILNKNSDVDSICIQVCESSGGLRHNVEEIAKAVKEINKTEDEVYCLEMPETHKFVQNGFYGWNCQGSQNKIIILFTPSSHTYMLNSNLLYVGLTRMQEKVFHIGDLKTVNNAVLKKENLERNTWLRNFKSN